MISEESKKKIQKEFDLTDLEAECLFMFWKIITEDTDLKIIEAMKKAEGF